MSRGAFPGIDYAQREHEDQVERSRQEREGVPGLELAADIQDISVIALRIKDERDEALRLLRRSLEVREAGVHGPLKSDIRAFLQRIGAAR